MSQPNDQTHELSLQVMKALQPIAVCSFLLFSAAMFLFFIAPVAVTSASVLDDTMVPSIIYGNAYEFSNFAEIGRLKGILIAQMVLACVAVTAGIVTTWQYYKKRQNYLETYIIMIALSLGLMIISSITIGEIKNLNVTADLGIGTLDLIVCGASPIFVLVFSILMILILTSGLVLNLLMKSLIKKMEAQAEKTPIVVDPYQNIRLSASPVTFIGDNAFHSHSELVTVKMGNLLTKIGEGSFAGCSSLFSVFIPESCTSIGKNAFAECGNLTKIFYRGTVEQWHAIEKQKDWDLNTGDYIISCMDGYLNK